MASWLHAATPIIIFAQILGIVAMAIDIWGTSRTNDKHLVLTIAGSSLVFALHFALLGAPAGAYSELMTAVRSLAAAYWKKTAVGIAFIVAYIAMGAYMVNPTNAWSLVETLPFIASVAGTIGMFWCRGVGLRVAFNAGQTCWLAYSLYTGSIGGSLLYAVLILGTIKTSLSLLRRKGAE